MNHSIVNPSPPMISLNQARSRSGTLSSLNNNSPSLLPIGSLNHELLGNSPMNSDSLGLPSMDTLPVDIPRMRSGSLFSTNSIWNDDISQHSNDDSLDRNIRQRSYTNNEDLDRNRRYTNNTDDLDKNRQRFYTANHFDIDKIEERVKVEEPIYDDPKDHQSRNRSYTTFDNKYQYKKNDINSLLDNLMEIEGKREMNEPHDGRLRSQTLVPVANLPLLVDNFDLNKISIITNFENSNLSPQKIVLIDNLPVFIDCMKLLNLFNNMVNQKLGNIISIKLSNNLNNSKIAICETSSIDLAMMIKNTFNHYELIPGQILYVAFAKIDSNDQVVTPPKIIKNDYTDLITIKPDLLAIIEKLSSKIDLNKIISIINKSINYSNDLYQNNFGPLPDPIPLRQFDSPKLRELRKVLENEHDEATAGVSGVNTAIDFTPLSQIDLESLCLSMLDELPELCYDYLGNTIIQKLFSLIDSKLIKLMMIKEIAPYITQLSIHKNGTWAIQKIINLCEFDLQQKYLIGASLKPYSVKLFNDQFGNYVLQGCIKFGSPFNDFIFETMLDNFLEISIGRFGARCIRTILETADNNTTNTPYITQEQIMLVAGLIVEFSNELVTNSNGSLLITWFLDTFNSNELYDRRFELLTNKFLPNLENLCIHKLSNLTILKILNNRSDLISKQIIMDKIFGKFDPESYEINDSLGQPSLLESILAENHDNTSAGPLFIYKILSNPILLTLGDSDDSIMNNKYHEFIINKIKRILLESNINNFQPYKKLMDEVGLPTSRLNRSSSMGNRRNNKRNNGSNHNNHGHGHNSHNHNQNHHTSMKNHQYNNNGSNGIIPNTFNLQNQYQQYSLPQQVMMNQMVGGAPQFMYNQQTQPPQQQQLQQFPISMGMVNQTQPPQNGQMQHQMYQYQQQMPIQNHQHQHQQSSQQQQQQQQQQDIAVMQQLEQLSLSSAALGYNSNPSTPSVASSQKNQFL